MGILLGLLCALLVIIPLGHGLWLLLAKFFRYLDDGGAASEAAPRLPVSMPRRSPDKSCVCCGASVRAGAAHCSTCGLDPYSDEAAELRDLETAARQMQTLLDAGRLDAATSEAVYLAIEKRQHDLIEENRLVPAGNARDGPSRRDDAIPLIESLEDLLAPVSDLAALKIERKQQALKSFRQLPSYCLSELSVGTLNNLARLLQSVGLVSRALAVYEALVKAHSRRTGVAEAALDAAKLAAHERHKEQACWFVEQALKHGLVDAKQAEATALLRELDPDRVIPLAPQVLEVAVNEVASAAPIMLEAVPAEPTPVQAAPVEAPPPPRRTLGELLTVFMEEKNILWGELVGGLLIVGCSVALVISLWQTLERIPYFPFVIFTAITAALFAAGLYTFNRWKLESTSRGVLVIASLLAPLNFSVLAGLSRDMASGWIDAAVALAGLGLLGWLLIRSGRVLVKELTPALRWPPELLLTVSVLGASVCQLLMHWLLSLARQDVALYVVGLLPVIFQALCTLPVLSRIASSGRLDKAQAFALFRFLGIAFFAAAVTIAFIIFASRCSPDHLALPIALLALPLFVSGVNISLPRQISDLPHVALLASVFLFTGMAVMLLAIAIAWPIPFALLAVSGFNAVVFFRTALVQRFRPAIPAAVACLTIAWLLLIHVLLGNVELATALPMTLLRAAFSGESGLALAVLAAACVAFAELVTRRGQDDAAMFARCGAAIGAAALLIALNNAPRTLGLSALSFAVCGFTAMLGNVRWRKAHWTYAGVAALFVAVAFGLHWLAPATPRFFSIALALLMHATCTVAAAAALQHSRFRDDLATSFLEPLRHTAVIASSAVPVALLMAAAWDELAVDAALAAWLAALWLVLAWELRRPVLVAAAQCALGVAVFFACAAWLLEQPWVQGAPRALLQPRAWCTFALGLAGFSLLWGLARCAVRKNARARELLETHPAIVDRVILASLLVGQMGLVVWALTPGVFQEIQGVGAQQLGYPLGYAFVLGWRAWTLIVLLALGLAANLSKRTVQLCTIAFLCLALTATAMLAAFFDEQVAVATALRWSLALGFLLLSLPFWGLPRLHNLTAELQQPGFINISRTLLIAGTVAPILFLSYIAAETLFAGQPPAGPTTQSVFGRLGLTACWLMPLVIVAAILAAHGFTARLPGFLYATGWLAPVSCATAYAIAIVQSRAGLGAADWVRIMQIASLAAALWAVAWSWLGNRLGAAASKASVTTSELLPLQGWLGHIIFWCPLLFATLCLTIWIAAERSGLIFATEAGSLLGWLALVACTAGWFAITRARRTALSTDLIGFTSLAVVLMVACSAERVVPQSGYRTLLLSTSVFALAWTLALPWLIRLAPARTVNEVGFATVAGLLTLLLVLGNAGVNADHLWSAAALCLIALAAWRLALEQRGELWAFLGANFFAGVATLIMWFIHRQQPLSAWWLELVQIDLCVLGVCALLWLRMRQHVYGTEHPEPQATVLLGLSLGALCISAAGFLAVALAQLIVTPEAPTAFLRNLGRINGWLALVPVVLAALWYIHLTWPRRVVHAVAATILLLGVQMACTASWWDRGDWLAHHVLTATWAGFALLMLAGCWAGNRLSAVGPMFWSAERRQHAARRLAALLPEREGRLWVTIVGLLTVGLAVRGAWGDPARPYWAVATTLVVICLLGAMALWSRRQFFVALSGLLCNVIGFVLWKVWVAEQSELLSGAELVSRFLYTQVICFGVAASLWLILENELRRRTPPITLGGAGVRFAHVATFIGMQLLLVVIAVGLAADVLGTGIFLGGELAWFALAFLAAAALCGLWDDAAAAAPLPYLYVCGLSAIALVLHDQRLSASWLGWHATWAAAAYVLVTVTLSGFALKLPLPEKPAFHFQLTERWFYGMSAFLGSILIAATLWIVFSFHSMAARLIAPLSIAFLAVTAFQLAQRQTRSHVLRYATLALGIMLLAELGWAGLPLDLPAPLLQRTATLLCSVVLGRLLVGQLAKLPLRQIGDLPHMHTGRALLALACILVFTLIAQEFVDYDPATGQTPLLRLDFQERTFHLLAWASAIAIAVLVIEAIVFALSPARSPWQLSAERRQGYVYLAELFFVLCLLHLRLNVPGLFPAVGPYWTLVVMATAFLGVGLGELFERRNLTVLSAPLRLTGMFLPVIPALAFLIRGAAPALRDISDTIQLPGLHALLGYLKSLPNEFGLHCLVWFLFGLLYLVLGLTRRSANLALAGALAANFGLWVIFSHHTGFAFLLHPQLWLIPLGLIVLAAEHVNRQALPVGHSLSLRYFGLLLIYVSSAADMFITGLGHSLLLPIVLALLAVLGVFAGIFFRIKAFLFAGLAFLLLVILAEIWHAAVDHEQTWVWWAAGIVLGAAILALFSLFEKYRNEVLSAVDSLKHWE